MSRTTETRTGSPVRTGPRDLRGFWRVSAAAVISLGPLSVMVGRGIMPYWTTDEPLAIVNKVLAKPGLMEVMSWAGIVFTPLLLLSVLGIAYVARRGAPVLATVGGGLSFLAWCMGANTADADYLTSTLGNNGFTPADITRITDLVQNTPVAATGGVIWLIGHIAGMILIGIAVSRAGLVPWWAGMALIISQPFHFVAAVIIPSRLLDLTMGWGLTTLGSAVVALAVLRMTNDQWDLPPLKAVPAR